MTRLLKALGRRPRRRERGQAMTEYVLLSAFVGAMLFVPYMPGPNGGANVSIFMLWIQAFDVYINSFHLVICLPVP